MAERIGVQIDDVPASQDVKEASGGLEQEHTAEHVGVQFDGVQVSQGTVEPSPVSRSVL